MQPDFCPFCGGIPIFDPCDRLITIKCDPCGYRRSFPGLLQRTPSNVPILTYRGADGQPYDIPLEECTEWYHADAHEKAIAAWNIRATGFNGVHPGTRP